MLKAILFDLGDTLFDFEPMDTRAIFDEAGRAAHAFLSARGYTLPPLRRYVRSSYSAVRWAYIWSKLRHREFNSFDLLRSRCEKLGIHLDDQTLRQLAWEWYAPMTRYSSIAPDVIPTLTKMRERGLKLAIVSNTFIPGFVLDRHMEFHGLLEYFPVRIYSSEVGYRKPHPRIFQIALEALGVGPDEAAFIGDLVKTDVVGARMAGMVTILRQPFANSRTHRIADHVVRRITELYQILPLLGAPDGDLPPIQPLACEG